MNLISAFRSSRPGFGGRCRLLVIGIAALLGVAVSSAWFWTAQRSWKGVMLERQVNLEKEVSGKALINVWKNIQRLDEGFLSGRYVHLPTRGPEQGSPGLNTFLEVHPRGRFQRFACPYTPRQTSRDWSTGGGIWHLETGHPPNPDKATEKVAGIEKTFDDFL